MSDITTDMRHQVIDDMIDRYLPPNTYADQWDADGLHEATQKELGIDVPVPAWVDEEGVDDNDIRERLEEASDALMAESRTTPSSNMMLAALS